MKNVLSFAGLALGLALLVTGCAGPENKLGRGLGNTLDLTQMSEIRRGVEQTAVFDSPAEAYTTGFIRGFDHEAARVGLGLYEVVTFPLPPYEPIFTHYVTTCYYGPESYHPGRYSDALFDTDTYIGFSGGDVAPYIMGSRFKIFDN
jgi:putative exosortase-associated protein (TIGR04073 family)